MLLSLERIKLGVVMGRRKWWEKDMGRRATWPSFMMFSSAHQITLRRKIDGRKVRCWNKIEMGTHPYDQRCIASPVCTIWSLPFGAIKAPLRGMPTTEAIYENRFQSPPKINVLLQTWNFQNKMSLWAFCSTSHPTTHLILSGQINDVDGRKTFQLVSCRLRVAS